MDVLSISELSNSGHNDLSPRKMRVCKLCLGRGFGMHALELNENESCLKKKEVEEKVKGVKVV